MSLVRDDHGGDDHDEASCDDGASLEVVSAIQDAGDDVDLRRTILVASTLGAARSEAS